MGRSMQSSPKRPRISVDVLPAVRNDVFVWRRQNAMFRCNSTWSRRLKNNFARDLRRGR